MPTSLPSTPVKNTRNSAAKFAATIQPLNELRDHMDSEMRKSFIGPMPVKIFFKKFLPIQTPLKTRGQLPEFGAMAGSRLECQMYNTFVRFLSPLSVLQITYL